MGLVPREVSKEVEGDDASSTNIKKKEKGKKSGVMSADNSENMNEPLLGSTD